MNIVFFGSSDFSINSLIALNESSHTVKAVVTQPDKKKGRGLKLASPPCAVFARKEGLPLYQPTDICSVEAVDFLNTLEAALFVVVSYGKILSPDILNIPELYSINIHTSILPKYRGAAPIEWAIMRGENTTGITVFKLEERLDSGQIILQREIKIKKDDDASSLVTSMSDLGAEVLMEAIELIENGKVEFTQQKEEDASLAPKIKSKDKLIDWGRAVIELYNFVRGLTTEGAAYTFIDSKRLKIWKTDVVSLDASGAKPGTVIGISRQKCIEVAANDGVLALLEVQIEGCKRMNAYDFALGHNVSIGDILSYSY